MRGRSPASKRPTCSGEVPASAATEELRRAVRIVIYSIHTKFLESMVFHIVQDIEDLDMVV